MNAEQVLYRQKESVRTIQVLGTVWTNESAQSTEARGRGGLPRDRNEGITVPVGSGLPYSTDDWKSEEGHTGK